MAVPGAESLGRTVLELAVDDKSYLQQLDAAEKAATDLGGTFSTVARDLSTFAQSVTKIGQQSQDAGKLISASFNSVKVSTDGLVGTMRQLTGVDLVTKAHQYAEAVAAIGGANKLTAKEQAGVNQTVTAAIEKYRVLGQTAPKSLLDLAKATQQADKETTSLAATMRSFSGTDQIARANEYAKAIEGIGGASKLTAKEQADVNQTVSAAIDKYRALGQEAPAHLLALQKATRQTEQSTGIFHETLSKLVAAFSISNLIDRAVGSLIEFGKNALESASRMVDLSNKTGLSLKTIQQFQFVSTQSGTSVDTLTDAVFKLSTTLGEGKRSARQAVSDLGLEFENLRNSRPDETFNEIIAALEKMEPGFQRNLAMQRLFGKGSKDVAKLVADGYTQMAKDASLSSDDQIRALDRAGDAWERFKSRIGTKTTSILGSWAAAVEQIDKLTAEQMAQYQAIIRSGGDGQKFLLQLAEAAEKAKKAVDIRLALDPNPLEDYSKHLKDLKDDFIALTPAQKAVIQQAVALHQSATDIAEGLHLSEDAVTNFIAQLKESEKTTAQTTNWITQLKNSTKELETELELGAKAGVPMEVMLKEFGSQIRDVTDKAPLLGIAIGDATKTALDALNKSDLTKVTDKAFAQINADARQLVGQMAKAGEDAGDRFAKGLKTANRGFIQEATQIEKGYIQLGEDSLDKRLALINLEYDAQVSALDKTGTLYAAHFALLEAERKAALDKATQDWEDHVSKVKALLDGLSKTLLDLPSLIISAFSGGGWGQALKSLGNQITSNVITPLLKSLTKVQQASISTGSSISAAIGGKVGGSTISNVAGIASSLGGAAAQAGLFGHAIAGSTLAIGAMSLGIGAAAIGAALLIKHFTDNKGRNAVKDWVTQNFGSFNALQKKLETLGDEGKQLWINLTQGVGHNNPRQAQAAIDAITTALNNAAIKDATFNTNLTTTLSKVLELGGGLDESLTGYLGQLKESGRLTQDNIDLLAELAGGGTITFQQLQEAAQRYGIDEDKLGQAFNAQKLHEGWQQVIDDLDLFGRANIDVNGLLSDMSDEISGLVNDSVKFGTDIPENMRPWIQKLIDAGKLLDDSGHKITDISKLKFGDSLQTTLETLNKTLKDLIATLKGVPPAIDAIPDNVDVNVNIREHHYRDDSAEGGAAAASGGIVGRGRILPFAAGGLVPHLDAFATKLLKFAPKGTDTVPAMLTPGEWVLNAPQQKAIAAALSAAATGMTVPHGLAGAYALPATGTTGRAAPVTVNYQPHHEISIAALDGASVGRIVKTREFQDALKDSAKQDLYGLRTHLQNVICTHK